MHNFPIKNILFMCWLLERRAGRDGREALGRLKPMLAWDNPLEGIKLEHALPVLVPELPAEERKLAQKLAAAIEDSKKVAELDSEPIWTNAKATTANREWPGAKNWLDDLKK